HSGQPLRFRRQRRVHGRAARAADPARNLEGGKDMSRANRPEHPVPGMDALMLGALLAFAAGGAGPAVAQESRAPLELSAFPGTALQVTHLDGHHAARKYAIWVWAADTQERAPVARLCAGRLPET